MLPPEEDTFTPTVTKFTYSLISIDYLFHDRDRRRVECSEIISTYNTSDPIVRDKRSPSITHYTVSGKKESTIISTYL